MLQRITTLVTEFGHLRAQPGNKYDPMTPLIRATVKLLNIKTVLLCLNLAFVSSAFGQTAEAESEAKVPFRIKNNKIISAEHFYEVGSSVDVIWKYVDRDGRVKTATVLVNTKVVDIKLGSVIIIVDSPSHRHLELASQFGELILSKVEERRERDLKLTRQKKVYSIVKIIESEIAAPGSKIGDLDDLPNE